MRFLAVTLLLIASHVPAISAQDAMANHLFPPDLVMAHRDAIGLTDSQGEQIKAAIQQAQAESLDLQWEIQAEARKLQLLVEPTHVDDEAALAQADRVMSLENRIKKTHLALLLRIKNALTDEQQQQLDRLRPDQPPKAGNR